jgi:hypothetical protein
MHNKLSFYERAALLGHDAEELKKGKTVTTMVTVASLDELTKLIEALGLSNPDDAAFVSEHLGGRVRQHVLGGDPLSDAEQAQIAYLFPMQFSAVSAADFNLNYELKVPISPQSPVEYNYGTLTFENGGCYLVQNTVFFLTADKVVVSGTTPGKSHLNILGLDATQGGESKKGDDGGDGGDGGDGTCSSWGIAGQNGDNGGDGKDGKDGKDGDNGNLAAPTLDATITISQSLGGSSPLTVFTRSGNGAKGGKGGPGGKGGKGGKGGNGKTCGCTGNSGGRGGVAGNGGDGGNGGNGSDAVDAKGTITLALPKGTPKSAYATASAPAVNGLGGDPGSAGNPGESGKGGSAGKYSSNGGDGGKGTKGSDGDRGDNAKGTGGAPAQFRIQN